MTGIGLGRLVWKNAFRNKRRTGLTILSVGFSLFLLMVLLTFAQALFNPSSDAAAASRLMVTRSTAVVDMMPIAYLDKIRRVPGVEYAVPLQWCAGVYKDPKNQFANFATDPKYIWDIYTEAQLSPETKAAFIANRQGAVAGEDLMKQFGWKTGEHITLTGTLFPVDLDLVIVGSFRAPAYQNMLYFRYDYLNEALGDPGRVGAFAVRASSPAVAPEVSERIDAMFRNSPAETKTQSEKAFVLSFVSMLGNVQTIIGSIVVVVVFTMLLVSLSAMSMTVRERLREMAVLKALGFPRRTVLLMVAGEAMLITALGAALGIGLAETLRLVNVERLTQGFVTGYAPSFTAYAATVGAGLLIGMVSGFAPAWRAANMPVMEAMRELE